MSFGAGMSAGMAAGMGAGIAVGVASGRENARRMIQAYSELHDITVRDKAGKPIPWDEFLSDAIRCPSSSSSRYWILASLLGLTLLGVAGTLLIWLLSA